jgi:hypothetical protein
MHAVLVTFTSAAGLDQLAGPFTDYAQAMRAVPGLISKTWLNDGATVGGFHIFSDRASAERYLNGEMFGGVRSNPAFSEFEIRHFDVIEGLSEITGSPRELAAAV